MLYARMNMQANRTLLTIIRVALCDQGRRC
jgi:hypothetical protein